jgi:dihydroflavonol-4-reductase
MSTYWITGGSGCLGAALAKHLVDQNYQVVLVIKPGTPVPPRFLDDSRVRMRVADLGQPDQAFRALAGADRVFHAAGLASPLDSDRARLWAANPILTRNVVAAAERHGVERLVHVSSSAAIGYPPDGMIADESFGGSVSRLTNAYAESKVAAEREVTDAVGRGLDAVIVNPTAVLARGGHPRFGWQAVLSQAMSGGVAPLPPGGSGFCTGTDFARGAAAAMDRGRTGERYILNSENLTFAELAVRMRSTGSWNGRTIRLPLSFLSVAGRMGAVWNALSGPETPKVPLTTETVALMQRRLYYDAGRAQRDLGFEATKVDAALVDIVAKSAFASDLALTG